MTDEQKQLERMVWRAGLFIFLFGLSLGATLGVSASVLLLLHSRF